MRMVQSSKRWESKWGIIFISPWLLGFLVFFLAPMVASLGFSFMNVDLANPDKTGFIGLDNWKRALFEDNQVLSGIGHTLAFSLLALPMGFLFAFIVAVFLNSKNLIAKKAFRTLFYLPTMIPMVAVVLIWSGILNAQTGWINQIIEALTGFKAVGVDGIRWLDDSNLIYITYSIFGLWTVGNTMLIFLAGLQSVPTELYEAAEIDGARWFTRLRVITLPLMTPVIFYNLIIGIIGALQYFLAPSVLNQGSGYPDGTTNFIMIYFYNQSFKYLNMGYGSVIAWIIFLIGLVIAVALFSTSKRWVYYAGGEKE